MKAVRTVIDLNGILYLKMRSVRSHSTSGRVTGGKKVGTVSVTRLVKFSRYNLPVRRPPGCLKKKHRDC